MPHSRRQFISSLAATAARGVAAGAAAVSMTNLAIPRAMAQSDDSGPNPICVFTKPFSSLSFDQLAESIAKLGFDGIEAPIRKGGHVENDRIQQDLPALVDALAKQNLKITVMTSDVNDPTSPTTETILRTASTLGIKRYRMKYFKYDPDQPVAAQIANWHDQCVDLAAMNHDFGITGLYQNHAGSNNMGAAIWDIAQVLDGIAPTDLGVAYDIRHAAVEGGNSWPLTFRMIRDHIDTVYVKDFVWEGRKSKHAPLGKGLVDPKFFDMLAETAFDGPISLHEEYIDHRDPKLVPEHLAAIEADFKVLKQWRS